ncbi:MAG: hypothetical protein ACREVE_10485 [Gammaproteobacteria bacterium]
MKMLERQLGELEAQAMALFHKQVVTEVAREPQAVGQAIVARLRGVRDAVHHYASNAALRTAVMAAIRAESPACAERIDARNSDADTSNDGT